MVVLVTGAVGHLGSATCEQLRLAGIAFRATDVRTRRDIGHRVMVANLLNREACYQLIEGCDVVVHIANHPNENAATPQTVFGENCMMNANVFQAAVDLGVKKILYASSVQAMIGSRRASQAQTLPSCMPYLPADSDTPARPGSTYGASKVAGEMLLRHYVEHHGLESAISLRWPGMRSAKWFERMRKAARPEIVWGDGYIDELGAWLSFADAGRLVVAIVTANLPGYRCYFPAHPSVRFQMSEQEMIENYYSGVPLRKPVSEMRGLVDISRITAETGWTPRDDMRLEPTKAS